MLISAFKMGNSLVGSGCANLRMGHLGSGKPAVSDPPDPVPQEVGSRLP